MARETVAVVGAGSVGMTIGAALTAAGHEVMPTDLPAVPGLELAPFYRPAAVGERARRAGVADPVQPARQLPAYPQPGRYVPAVHRRTGRVPHSGPRRPSGHAAALLSAALAERSLPELLDHILDSGAGTTADDIALLAVRTPRAQ